MTDKVLARASALKEKINNLEYYLDRYAIPAASCHKIKIIPKIRKIMTVIPLGIIVYFWICSPGFLDPFYHGSGYLVSAVLMIVYLLSDFWSRKICCIHI